MSQFTCPMCRKSFALPTGAAAVSCPDCGGKLEPPTVRRWFFAKQKKKLGPYTWQQLKSLTVRGDLRADDMLLQEGAKQWHRAETLPDLFTPTATNRDRRMPWWWIAGLAVAGLGVLAVLSVFAGYYFWARPAPADQQRVHSERIAQADEGSAPKKDAGRSESADTKPSHGVKNPEPPPRKASVEQFVERLNRARKAVGLGNVSVDDELSRGCQAHAKYLARHIDPDKADGANVFEEDPNQPGYSIEGERAGKVASVTFAEPLTALELWMGRLTGRIALLNPEMQSIGLGFERGSRDDWVCVLDAVRGRSEPIVVYPVPKQTDVPLTFSGGPELPAPKTAAGFPITITFPVTKKITNAALELHDEKGAAIEGWLWTPGKPVRPGFQHNALALIPKETLRNNALYQVKASAQVDGQPWSLAWSFTTEDDSDGKGIWIKKAIAKVNSYRAHAGLKPVILDDKLSRGCLAHARYLALNEGHPALQGLKAHDEDLSLPGSSKDGQMAGKASDIAIGDYEPIDGVDAWMATLYHRVPILEPSLQSIGFGCARGRRFGWVTVMNVLTGRDKSPRPRPVFYPVPDQIDVPVNFPNGGEEPTPIPDDTDGKAGYPITAFFPFEAPLVKSSGNLTDAAGVEVPCWFSSPEKLANPRLKKEYQGTTVCLIAKDPLAPHTTYQVTFQGELAGQAWQKKWKFTTGDAGATVAQATRQVVERVNHFRAIAGLSAIALDENLSRGCQLHAEYLVQHAAMLQKTNASANDEDPLLPSFTAEGRRSAKQSDVFTNAFVPVTQIDDVMATFTRRVYLLDPNLQRLGFGCAHDIGRGWRCVLDLNGGRGDGRVIRYPAPNQDAVPILGFDRFAEAKGKTVGFPITVTFPKQASVRNAHGLLTLDGVHVDFHISSPEKPLSANSQRTTIGVHPLASLQTGRSYSVTVSAIIDGSEWRQTWQFTTATSKN